MPGIGVNIAIIDGDQVLLTQREDFEVWCLPGGGVDPGESVAQAAVREALEETGLEVQLTRLVGVYSRPKIEQGAHTVLFAAHTVGGELRLATGETIAARFFTFDALPELMLWWHRQQIRDALDGVGGAVAWSFDVTWLGDGSMTRQELYQRRDQSGLSRQEFYRRFMAELGPDDQRREL